MDAGLLGTLMIAAGLGAWLLDRFGPPAKKPPTGQALEGIVDKTIQAAKTLPFPALLVVLGFFLVLLDNRWLTLSAGG
ncbi:MAG: hypothetical protein OEM32_03510 [Acidimicrobiia bacterium]|nr:hypothetical protein [Acidimicrobiia bacterium]